MFYRALGNLESKHILYQKYCELGQKVEKIIKDNFDLSPRGIRELLNLNKPIYEVTSSYGHFGRKPTNKGEFSWEKTDKTSFFKKV